ncbi:CD63 antigen isoform X2 [Chiloscyllium punctatum]|uniref:CD63 antigen isoform X2 n=1 Tax=Chiloscyllium plagiosum TaxID=36176 RepID=UPI001CB81D1C|nr:CD63 antigen isoform X2 [Chiloscyllium plagiosum]
MVSLRREHWVSGIALIVIGILVQTKLNGTLHITSVTASGAPIVIIIVGVVINFVAFFGCCGAWKENYCMVTTFAVLLILIFIVEIAAAIAGYIFKDQIREVFEKSFNDTMANYNKTGNAVNIDELQKQFRCCGSTSYRDWLTILNNTVPDSCCKNETQNCGKTPTPNKVYEEGCVNVINTWLKNNIVIVAGVALGIALFQLLGIIFACVLMKGIRSGYEVM